MAGLAEGKFGDVALAFLLGKAFLSGTASHGGLACLGHTGLSLAVQAAAGDGLKLGCDGRFRVGLANPQAFQVEQTASTGDIAEPGVFFAARGVRREAGRLEPPGVVAGVLEAGSGELKLMATRMDLIKQAAPAAIKVFNRPAGCRVLLSQPLLFGGRFLHVACLPVAFFDQCGGLFFCGAAGLVGGFNGLSRRRLIAE